MLPDLPCKLDAAKRILKGRWGEDTKRGCYTLDGRPCNAKDLLREAVRAETADHEQQVTEAAHRAADDLARNLLRGMGDVPRTIEQAQDEGV